MSPGFGLADVEEAEVGGEAGRAEDVQRGLRRRQRPDRACAASRRGRRRSPASRAARRRGRPARSADPGSRRPRPTACPVIGSPTSVGFAYERAVLIRPRMYGSSESHCERTSTSPGPGDGTSPSTSAKSTPSESPPGRAASVICRFTIAKDLLTAGRSGEAATFRGLRASRDPRERIARHAPESNGASRARTGDLLAASQTLSQLSYGPWVSEIVARPSRLRRRPRGRRPRGPRADRRRASRA